MKIFVFLSVLSLVFSAPAPQDETLEVVTYILQEMWLRPTFTRRLRPSPTFMRKYPRRSLNQLLWLFLSQLFPTTHTPPWPSPTTPPCPRRRLRRRWLSSLPSTLWLDTRL